MFTKAFWRATAERVVSTMAQAASALVVGGAGGILEVDFRQVASVSALAGVAALFKALAASRFGESESPSFTDAERLPEEGKVVLTVRDLGNDPEFRDAMRRAGGTPVEADAGDDLADLDEWVANHAHDADDRDEGFGLIGRHDKD